MKNMKLTRNEVMACRELFEKIATEPAVLDRMLQTLGKDPAGIRAELNRVSMTSTTSTRARSTPIPSRQRWTRPPPP